MQTFELTIEGHGHNILAQSEHVKQDWTGLGSLTLSELDYITKPRSGHLHVKGGGGRMIVLQIKKLPLSLIFPEEKRTPFIKKR